MSRRTATRLAWSLCALSLVLALLGVFFLVLVHRSSFEIPSVNRWLEDVVVQVGFSPLFAVPTALSFSTIGAVIASRRPDNPTGWIFCAIGLFGGLRLLSTEYAAYSLVVDPGSLPAGEALAWIASWLWVPDFGLFLFLALMYPDGRLPSPRWRPFAQLVLVVVVVGTVAAALSPGSIRGLEPIENPLGIDGAPNVAVVAETLVYALGLVATASVLVRLGRSRGVKRLQIKWFA